MTLSLLGAGAAYVAAGGGAAFTWNPADSAPAATLSNGNRDFTPSNTTTMWSRATVSKSTGKWYWEVTFTAIAGSSPACGLGFGTSAFSLTTGGTQANQAYMYFAAGSQIGSGFSSGTGSTVTAVNAYSGNVSLNDVYGFAIDFGAGNVWISKNGSWAGTSNPATGTNPWLTFTPSLTLFPAGVFSSSSASTTIRLASTASQTVPSGFTLLNG